LTPGDLRSVVVEHVETDRIEIRRQLLGEFEGRGIAPRRHDLHVERRDRCGPDEALVVVVQLGDDREDPRDTDAVRAHRDRDELAVLVEHLQPSASAYLRPSWKTWPISMPRASSTGPEPSGAGSPGRTVATSTYRRR
jgi:hypothetical protein